MRSIHFGAIRTAVEVNFYYFSEIYLAFPPTD